MGSVNAAWIFEISTTDMPIECEWEEGLPVAWAHSQADLQALLQSCTRPPNSRSLFPLCLLCCPTCALPGFCCLRQASSSFPASCRTAGGRPLMRRPWRCSAWAMRSCGASSPAASRRCCRRRKGPRRCQCRCLRLMAAWRCRPRTSGGRWAQCTCASMQSVSCAWGVEGYSKGDCWGAG